MCSVDVTLSDEGSTVRVDTLKVYLGDPNKVCLVPYTVDVKSR